MRVEIWSDVRCPWCLIGLRRFERALEARPDLQVERVYRSFELDPQQQPPPPGADIAAVLARKYGMPRERALALLAHVTAEAAGEGLAFDFEGQAREGGSFDAHRLLQWARAQGPGAQHRLKERLMRACFCEGRSLRSAESLLALAVEAGLPAAGAAAVLAEPALHADAVRADEAAAAQLGIRGVPFFVIDGQHGISGAQPVEVWAQVFGQLAPAPAAPACGPAGGCAL